jgi:hypothetical protein
MAIKKCDSYYAEVSAGQEVYSYLTPGNGKEWEIKTFHADAPSSSDGWVALIWDYDGAGEEIITLTYTSTDRVLNRSITGDGTKKLAIVLHNGGSDNLVMGGEYDAKEL